MSPTLLPAAVYVLCMVTSLTCTLLLGRAYAANRARLLLWTAVSFGLFFLKFWARTRDRLFLAFALAFWLLCANSIALTLMGGAPQSHSEVYLLRLAAFLLIIGAILNKNVGCKR